MKMLSKVLED